jgi:glycosyltransferase involved in cell wall biosynthesis
MRVLFLLPYPLHRAPSQRFRVENLLPLLDEAGINYTLRPFMDEKTWNMLYKGGSAVQKVSGILKGFRKRWYTVLREAKDYDWVFIHREAAPLGPPWIEQYLKNVLKKRIVYDFDDAIWIPNTSAENALAARFKAFWKVPRICSWSHTITAGNDYLCDFAATNSKGRVVRMPTVVDTKNRYNRLKQHYGGKPVVGWTGSHSTLKYLDELMPLLRELRQELDFSFAVIADKKPDLDFPDWSFIPWDANSEIEDLLNLDIGVMPLTPDPWSEGKCGFKLIQYLALGIPALATPVGVNARIIAEGENGFLCEDQNAWKAGLRKLIMNASLREQFGRAGREKMIAEYSVQSITSTFLNVFKTEKD